MVQDSIDLRLSCNDFDVSEMRVHRFRAVERMNEVHRMEVEDYTEEASEVHSAALDNLGDDIPLAGGGAAGLIGGGIELGVKGGATGLIGRVGIELGVKGGAAALIFGAVVLVGAFGVGRITLQICDLVTNTGTPDAAGTLTPARSVGRSDELGVFHLGSTVIVVAPTDRWRWTVGAGDTVRVGRPIARRVD